MTAAEEKARRDTIKNILSRISATEAFTRVQLFEDAPHVARTKSWQHRILNSLSSAGIISSEPDPTARRSGQYRWRLCLDGDGKPKDVSLYLTNPRALTAMLRGSDVDDFDIDDDTNIVDPAAERERAERRLDNMRAESVAQRAASDQSLLKANEPVAVSDPQEEVSHESEPPDAQGALVKMSYANLQNLVYLRKKIDEQGAVIAALNAKFDDFLKLWNK